MTLDDVGARLPWRAAGAWMANAGPGTALFRDVCPEAAPWLDGRLTSALLADVFDSLQCLTYLFGRAHAKNPGSLPPPEPLPRPWDERGSAGKRYGSGPIPADEFASWWAAHVK